MRVLQRRFQIRYCITHSILRRNSASRFCSRARSTFSSAERALLVTMKAPRSWGEIRGCVASHSQGGVPSSLWCRRRCSSLKKFSSNARAAAAAARGGCRSGRPPRPSASRRSATQGCCCIRSGCEPSTHKTHSARIQPGSDAAAHRRRRPADRRTTPVPDGRHRTARVRRAARDQEMMLANRRALSARVICALLNAAASAHTRI